MANDVFAWVNIECRLMQYMRVLLISCIVWTEKVPGGVFLAPASCAVMFRSPVWIMVVFVIFLSNPKVSGIAVNLGNIARGRTVSDTAKETIYYDKLNINDGDDNTISHVYFPLRISLTIDLSKPHTVQYVIVKLTSSAYSEIQHISAVLSYSTIPSFPTLNHTFTLNECRQPEKRDEIYILYLYRCCGVCCDWNFVGKGWYVTINIEKKKKSPQAFGIHEIDVRGEYSSDDRNLAQYQPVLDEHNGSCETRDFVANDGWTDTFSVKVPSPPFRWRVDFGYPRQLGVIRIVYTGQWGDAKLVLMDEKGKSVIDKTCPTVRSEYETYNTICCDIRKISSNTRWLEVRGAASLPKMIEIFVYSRFFKFMDECPVATEPPSTLPTTTLYRPTTSIPSNAEASYSIFNQSKPSNTNCVAPMKTFVLICSFLMSWYFTR